MFTEDYVLLFAWFVMCCIGVCKDTRVAEKCPIVVQWPFGYAAVLGKATLDKHSAQWPLGITVRLPP